MYSVNEKRFVLLNQVTIISLFVLILAGGIVRSSGSGMGCPDWPKCFGRYIPPVSEAELPAGYEREYVADRVLKNQKFAAQLEGIGFSDLAAQVRSDQSVTATEKFNAFRTWTEYVNRLIGAITGFLMLGRFALSFIYLKSKPRIIIFSFLNLVLVAFQAWLGSIVVSTNLLAWVVTVHMLIALGILAICIFTYFSARKLREKGLLINKSPGPIQIMGVFTLVIIVFQVTLGTEVREQIDVISRTMELNRSEWVTTVGMNFNFHRDMSILVFAMSLIVFFMIKGRYPERSPQYLYSVRVMMIIILQSLTGMFLAYVSLPPAAQAIHILLASLLFGAEFYLILLLQRNKLYIKKRGRYSR